jgi:phytoene dehydrogenase-like protein
MIERRDGSMTRVNVIGAGPNGLAAAIVLARAGLQVDVFESEEQPGGAVRSMALTLPGFLHDAGSAVYPLGAGSPFFNELPLRELGLEWIHGDAALAHPLDDGTAVLLEHDLLDAEREFGEDGRTWRSLVQPIAEHWKDFTEDALSPPLHIPRHPLLMAQFGIHAIQSAEGTARSFKSSRTQALFGGLAGHSLLSFDRLLGSAVGLVLGGAAHAVGWPIPRGGAQRITDALVKHLHNLGGTLHTLRRINSVDEIAADGALTLCDLTPKQMMSIARRHLSPGYQRTLQRFKYGPGVFKLDYALSDPVPWRAAACRRAITVHLGGTFAEIASSEYEVAQGRTPERPFVLLAQPTLYDQSRAPKGRHVVWAYCHVPNGSTADMTSRIEAQIERFAPGFQDCILSRHVLTPARLEQMDTNLVGGDINAGAFSIRQIIFRPGIRSYGTGNPGLYLCSASTPPGGGVHGMCGYHAAKMVLRHGRLRERTS